MQCQKKKKKNTLMQSRNTTEKKYQLCEEFTHQLNTPVKLDIKENLWKNMIPVPHAKANCVSIERSFHCDK